MGLPKCDIYVSVVCMDVYKWRQTHYHEQIIHLCVIVKDNLVPVVYNTPNQECNVHLYLCLLFVCLFVYFDYVPSTIFQVCRDGSSWVEPVLSYD